MSTTAACLTAVSGLVVPGEEPVRTLSRNSATGRGTASTSCGDQPTDRCHDGKASPVAAFDANSVGTTETVPA